jgi:hypothetical protein
MARSTTMTIGTYKFAFDFDTRELRLFHTGSQMLLDPDVSIALGDFLFEVLTAQGRAPRILPLKIANIEVKTNIKEA